MVDLGFYGIVAISLLAAATSVCVTNEGLAGFLLIVSITFAIITFAMLVMIMAILTTHGNDTYGEEFRQREPTNAIVRDSGICYVVNGVCT